MIGEESSVVEEKIFESCRLLPMISVLGDIFGDEVMNIQFFLVIEMHDS